MSKIKWLPTLVLVAIVATAAVGHATVVLDVDGSGNLTGAQNIDINGAFYDVQFEDGTCGSLFNGCTSTSDFAFHNVTDATAAAQALLDQVLPGFSPSQVAGCTFLFECFSLIPYDVTPPNMDYAFVDNSVFILGFFPASNVGSGTDIPTTLDTTTDFDYNFAVFTASPVATPEPATIGLLCAGLAGLAAGRRKRTD